jgi:hypothetical protein
MTLPRQLTLALCAAAMAGATFMGCATSGSNTAGRGSASAPAARPGECAPSPRPCSPGPVRAECFETLPAVPYAGNVRVTNRLKPGDCAATTYCQCVTATVAGGRACTQCRTVEFQRLLNGDGHWHTEVYELGPEVTAVVEVMQTASTSAPKR